MLEQEARKLRKELEERSEVEMEAVRRVREQAVESAQVRASVRVFGVFVRARRVCIRCVFALGSSLVCVPCMFALSVSLVCLPCPCA